MWLPQIVRILFMESYCYGDFFLDILLNVSPKNIWDYLGDIFGVMSERQRRAATGIQWVRARDATKYLTIYRIASPSIELSSIKCQ